MLASYEATFARSWGRKARALFAEFAPEWFGVTVSDDAAAAADWCVAGHDGGMVTAGVGGPLTGRGANLLIVDDPIKNSEESMSEAVRASQWDWWQSTAATRLEPGGVAIVMATRWHREDLTGRLLDASEKDGEPVTRLRLPALAEPGDTLGRDEGQPLWPERWPLEVMQGKQRATDVYWWNALYQQRPSKHGRTEWPAEYFGDWLWLDSLGDVFDMCVVAIDPSKGRDARRGDYSAIAFAGLRGGEILCDVWMGRRPSNALVAKALDMAQQYAPDAVALESNAWQDLLAPEFDRQAAERGVPPLPLDLIENRVAKELRISRLGPYLSRRKLRFLDTPGSRLCVRQLEEFPLGDHDDGPDAVEMAIRALARLAATDHTSPELERYS